MAAPRLWVFGTGHSFSFFPVDGWSIRSPESGVGGRRGERRGWSAMTALEAAWEAFAWRGDAAHKVIRRRVGRLSRTLRSWDESGTPTKRVERRPRSPATRFFGRGRGVSDGAAGVLLHDCSMSFCALVKADEASYATIPVQGVAH